VTLWLWFREIAVSACGASVPLLHDPQLGAVVIGHIPSGLGLRASMGFDNIQQSTRESTMQPPPAIQASDGPLTR
jgi:hypothetical protein